MSELRDLLSEAVRSNDDEAEKSGFEAAIENVFGAGSLPDVLHVARQRAMRMVLVSEGRPINEENMRSVLETPSRNATMVNLMAVFLDGLCLGWEAHRRQGG